MICIDDLLSDWTSGKLKLYLTTRVLNFRRAHAPLFSRGSYLPLTTVGAHRDSVFAFARHFERSWLVVAVPRLLRRVAKPGVFPLGRVWGTTGIEFPPQGPGVWKDLLTHEEIDLSVDRRHHPVAASALFRHLPFSVLVNTAESL